jgi:hypothetical protein
MVWSAGLRARILDRYEASGRALIHRFLLRDRFEARELSVLMTREPDRSSALLLLHLLKLAAQSVNFFWNMWVVSRDILAGELVHPAFRHLPIFVQIRDRLVQLLHVSKISRLL